LYWAVAAKPFWLRWWFVALVVLLALVAISTIIIYKRRKLFRKLALLEEKIQLEKNLSKSVLTSIKAQMNPHFFYNALNTIQAYIFTNDADNAGKYLSKFSKLTRRILEMSEAEFVNLSEEINTLKLYLELEEARFDDDFFFKIEVDENVDLDMMRIPPMLIQPYIENAIKHGLLHKSGEKHLRVSFEIREEILMISIDDNGIGRATSNQRNAIKNAKHKSFATEANAKRLEVLNQTGETPVTCEIIDKVDANNSALGTCVILRIPPHTDKNF
jgi:LytS/YehU family sensor histidine kinase